MSCSRYQDARAVELAAEITKADLFGTTTSTWPCYESKKLRVFGPDPDTITIRGKDLSNYMRMYNTDDMYEITIKKIDGNSNLQYS